MIYGYARVSTNKQAKDGNSLEAQKEVLTANGAQVIYMDAFTGKVANRPQFDNLRKVIKQGDTLIITKLDRIARSVIQGTLVIEDLLNQGIIVHVLNIGRMDDSATGKLIRTIMLAFAEFERQMIVERTQEGKKIAREKPGYMDGRPKKFTKKQIMHAMELLNDHSYTQVVELTGISKATLYRARKSYVVDPALTDWNERIYKNRRTTE